jgi:hypothetical protein
MSDRHLNLFYTYNRDAELVENNLTRAWIVSLKLLSGRVRDGLLRSLLEEPFRSLAMSQPGELPCFVNAQFALQGYMDASQANEFPDQYILTIASNRYGGIEDDSTTKPEAQEREGTSGAQSSTSGTYSIPDAWIYDEKEGYCFLIEAKVGLNPVDDAQVKAHAAHWFGMTGREDVRSRLLPLTWIDVLQAIGEVRSGRSGGDVSLNDQESQILEALEDFIGFFGYHIFYGFDFRPLQNPPKFTIPVDLLAFSDLDDPPFYCLIPSNS